MVKVQIREVKRFVTACLRAAGARIQPATEQAELITYADFMGHESYGISKLATYVNDIKDGACQPNNNPLILKEKSSTAWVDAKDVMGATAGSFAMDLAIKKANDTGLGWVAIKGSYHDAEPYSYWTRLAINNGLIGIVFSNTSSIQQPPGKKQQVDKKIPNTQPKKIVIKKMGRAQNRRASSGKRDIELAFKSMKPSISSVSAPELAAILKSSESTDEKSAAVSRSWMDDPFAQNLAQCFVAVNPACFALGFDGKLAQTIPQWKRIDPINTKLLETPLVDLAKEGTAEFREGDMLSYELQQMNAIIDLAVKLNVKPMHLHENGETLT